jgi:hypothetical protein
MWIRKAEVMAAAFPPGRAELMVPLRTVLRTIRMMTIFLVCEKLVEESSS